MNTVGTPPSFHAPAPLRDCATTASRRRTRRERRRGGSARAEYAPASQRSRTSDRARPVSRLTPSTGSQVPPRLGRVPPGVSSTDRGGRQPAARPHVRGHIWNLGAYRKEMASKRHRNVTLAKDGVAPESGGLYIPPTHCQARIIL